VTLEKLEEELL